MVVADYGLQRTPLMRLLFRQVQMVDGFALTTPNARGVLPSLMAQAGFAAGRGAAGDPHPDRFDLALHAPARSQLRSPKALPRRLMSICQSRWRHDQLQFPPGPDLTRPILQWARGVMPALSQTEREAIDAGDTWWDAALFTGDPDWNELLAFPPAKLRPDEQAFIDGPVNTLCAMVNDWR
jgi:hypothetical protein